MKLAHLIPLLQSLLSATVSAKKATNPNSIPKNAVLLSDIQSLTLRAGKQTASRRVSPVPQLQCVGPPNVCNLYSIDTMRCTNEGTDYDAANVQWSCKASVPEEFKLGSTDVSCEGYESSEDPYVLKGSCGVEYRLILTGKGEEKYGKQRVRDDWDRAGGAGFGEKWAGYVFMAVFCAVLFIIARAMVQAWRRDDRGPGGGRRFGVGGGGGGNDDNDPPPPYDYHAPPKKPTTRTSTRSSSSRTAGGDNQQGWRPGFWTGTLAGAAGGYLAGQRANRTQQPEVQERPGAGSWFGGGNRNTGYAAPSSSYGSGSGGGSSSSGPSYSSSRHESTGFGGTSRR